ncbi:MAG: NAD-binding protein [Treponema sp.]|nr:NAD-binding protein [Treponema sp.]MBQ2081903.1 NAD-binding protein [Treponema sp.]MBR6295366.1 NAD-binding protein [Treponema sp.]MEE3313075.1 NAD-binding protein [Treponema sp.]
MKLGKKRKKARGVLKRKIKRIFSNPFTYIGIIIVISICVATYIVYLTESGGRTDSDIDGWFDTIWHTIVAVSAAYFDYYVKSVPGRMASLVLLLFGMIIFSFITGKITSGFMNLLMKGNKGLKKLRNMKGHFIICGWRPGFDKILEAVMVSNPDILSDMIVLVNEAPAEQIEQLKSQIQFKDINYVAGDFADAAVLKRAFVQTAKRALVLSDQSKKRTELETDSQTVLAVLAMKNENASMYIAAEIIDKKFEEHLQLAHCDEILLTQEYEHGLLATASSGLGYSNVIKSLIGEDAESGIIIDDIPGSFEGKPYKDLLSHVAEKSGEVLVGLLLNTRQSSKKDVQATDTQAINVPLLTPGDDFVIPKGAKSILICANY